MRSELSAYRIFRRLFVRVMAYELTGLLHADGQTTSEVMIHLGNQRWVPIFVGHPEAARAVARFVERGVGRVEPPHPLGSLPTVQRSR